MKNNQDLIPEQYYHIFNKSIANFTIFNDEREYQRMLYTLQYYQPINQECSLAHFLQSDLVNKIGLHFYFTKSLKNDEKLIEIIAYCLMPTHIHLIVKQLTDGGISKFMNNSLNSYTRYFNKRHNRLGPLWVGRFKRVLIETDEQLHHVSRYIHLNPTTANLIKKPEDWPYSSYREYVEIVNKNLRITPGLSTFNMSLSDYKKFVEDQIEYQKELANIKHLILE